MAAIFSTCRLWRIMLSSITQGASAPLHTQDITCCPSAPTRKLINYHNSRHRYGCKEATRIHRKQPQPLPVRVWTPPRRPDTVSVSGTERKQLSPTSEDHIHTATIVYPDETAPWGPHEEKARWLPCRRHHTRPPTPPRVRVHTAAGVLALRTADVTPHHVRAAA